MSEHDKPEEPEFGICGQCSAVLLRGRTAKVSHHCSGMRAAYSVDEGGFSHKEAADAVLYMVKNWASWKKQEGYALGFEEGRMDAWRSVAAAHGNSSTAAELDKVSPYRKVNHYDRFQRGDFK